MQMDCEIRRGNRCLPLSITKQKRETVRCGGRVLTLLSFVGGWQQCVTNLELGGAIISM